MVVKKAISGRLGRFLHRHGFHRSGFTTFWPSSQGWCSGHRATSLAELSMKNQRADRSTGPSFTAGPPFRPVGGRLASGHRAVPLAELLMDFQG